jgi:hypothetical protein
MLMFEGTKDRYKPHWRRIFTELLKIPDALIDGRYHPEIPSPCCGAMGGFMASPATDGSISCHCNSCGGPKGTGGIVLSADLAAKVLGVSRADALRRIDAFLGFEPEAKSSRAAAIAAAIADVDSDWQLIPIGTRKQPIDPDTGLNRNDWGHNTYDVDGITSLLNTSPHVRAVGVVLGEPSGIIAVDFDGKGSTAAFQEVFGRPYSDLPRTVSWSSGRPNRRQLAFRVPHDVWEHLRGRRYWEAPDGRIVLELRAAGHQSVIAGEHPDTAGYHWINSPSTTNTADAPEWLLEPLYKAPDEPIDADYQAPSADDADRAVAILQHIKPREGYEGWLRVGMALHSVDPGLLSAWVDWSRGCSNFDEAECLAKWASFKRSGVTLGTLYFLAKQDGWRPRRDPIPGRIPLDDPPSSNGNGHHQQRQASAPDDDPDEPPLLSYRELLAQALDAIRADDEDAEMETRAEIMARFRRNDGQITAALFRLLSAQMQADPAERPAYRSIDLSRVVGIDWLLEGFIPENDQALLYAPAGAGKTTAALGMAFAITDGTGFLDHDTKGTQGNALLIASDSGAGPLIRTLAEMGRGDDPALSSATDGSRLHVWAHDPDQGAMAWEASLKGCLKLLEFVQAHSISLVLIDSCKAVTSKADLNYCDNGQVTALLTFCKEVLCRHCAVVWINHEGTGGSEAAGAKAWKEVPSIVHSIDFVPVGAEEDGEGRKTRNPRMSTSLRCWRVRKCRQGTAREFLYQVDENTGRLVVNAAVEVKRDCRAHIVDVLALAYQAGKASLSRKAICEELFARFGYSKGTVSNGLTRVTGGRNPEVLRVGSLPGHYRLAPRVIELIQASQTA